MTAQAPMNISFCPIGCQTLRTAEERVLAKRGNLLYAQASGVSERVLLGRIDIQDSQII